MPGQNRRQKWIITVVCVTPIVLFFVLCLIVFLGPDRKTEAARIDATRWKIGTIGTALDAFQADVGRYPTVKEGLRALIHCPYGKEQEKWRGPYLPSQDFTDTWGHEFLYICPSRYPGYGFDLISAGRDGQFGTKDDLTIGKEFIVRTRIRINALTKNLNAFRAAAGRYPSTQEGVAALYERPANLDAKRWKGPYAHQGPEDAWKTPIRYAYPSSQKGKKFDLVSAGPDKTFGTPDDLASGWDGTDLKTDITQGSMPVYH